MSTRSHYFWIDKEFVTKLIEDFQNGTAIDQAMLLGYFLHLRSCNPKQENKSFAGEKKCLEVFGFGNPYFKEANDRLESVKLITKGASRGVYKSCYRVLSGKGDGQERGSKNDNADAVFLPSNLIDDGVLKDMYYEEIIALLLIYLNLNLRSSYGVDWRFVHIKDEMVASDKQTKKGENLFKIKRLLWPNDKEIIASEMAKKYLSQIMGFKEAGLIEWLPVVIERKTWDANIITVLGELPIYDRERVWTELKPNQSVFWIIRPIDKYLPKNEMYRNFQQSVTNIAEQMTS